MLVKTIIGLYAFPGANLNFFYEQFPAVVYERLIACEKAIMKAKISAPNEIASSVIIMHLQLRHYFKRLLKAIGI
jgi:hypothetical protein